MFNHKCSPRGENINIRNIKCSFRMNVEEKVIKSYGDIKFLNIL